jgi:hypothetical protein
LARAPRAPALLLHGENDRQVPVEQAEELASVLASRGTSSTSSASPGAGDARSARDVVVRRFPGTDHLFLEDHDGEPRGYVRLADRRLRRDVTETVVKWLARRAVANDR